MGGAEIGVVVDDDVALLDATAERVHEAADVPGQRADVHRRRVGLAQLPALGVEDAGAEVLGLADDRRVAHPEEHARHLLRDRVKGAAEHTQRDRVDLDPLPGGRARLATDLVLDHAQVATTSSAPLAVSGPSAAVTPGKLGTSTHGVPTSRAICAANSGPAPPSATSAKSRGSKPLRTEFSSIDCTIECVRICNAPIEASSTLMPRASAGPRSKASRARSARSCISPPRNASGRSQPRLTIASVAVGSVPPRPYAAGPGSAPAERGPTRKIPPEST